MFRRTFAFGGMLLVAAALGFGTPGPAHAAQPRGGFRAPVPPPRPPTVSFAAHAPRPAGGFSLGSYRPHPWPGHPGMHPHPHSTCYGLCPHGWIHHGSFGHGSFGHRSFGWGAYYPNYGGYASYGGYGGYASNPSYSSNPYSDTGYSPYDYSGYAGAAGYDPSGAAAYSAQPAYVTLTVPASAKVWFEGTLLTSTGPVRQVATPPLAPGRTVTYWARARWTENGQESNQVQPVEVTAGGQYHVRFPAPRPGG
jgi:uncharacterized protein (TIGR03000 family)